VVKRDRGPVAGAVAGCASRREARARMAGIRGFVEVALVAAVTGGWQRFVVVVGVALGAGDGGVGPGQWEHSGVIERRGAPSAGGVAQRAVRREPHGHVFRIRGAAKVLLMARVASR